MTKKLGWAVAVAITSLSHGALADSAPAAPTLDKILAASGITEQAYIEGGYSAYSFSAPNSTNGAPTSLNYFENRGNTFELKKAYLQLAKQPTEGVGGLINVVGGSDAGWIKSYPYQNTTPVPGPTGQLSSNSFDLTQAFLQYAHGIYTIQAGKYYTLAGAEVVNDEVNTNISHSIANLNAIPITHTGVRLTVAPSSTLSFVLGEVNGWDQQQARVAQKTTELGLAFNPSANLNWSLQGYYGDALASNTTGYNSDSKLIVTKPFITSPVPAALTLVDTVLTLKPTAAFSVVLNGDYGSQDKAFADGSSAKWYAGDLYLNYQFNDQWRESFRLEDFDDKDGYKLGYGQGSTKSATLTIGFAPTSASELRAEIREDKLPASVIYKGNGLTDKVGYGAVEGIYKF